MPTFTEKFDWKIDLACAFSPEVSGQPRGAQPSTGRDHRECVMSLVAQEGTMHLPGWNESFKGVPDFYFRGIMLSFCEIKFVFK